MNTPYNEVQKERIYNWRKNNPEKYKESRKKTYEKNIEENRKKLLDYYYKNKEEINARRREKYRQKKLNEAGK